MTDADKLREAEIVLNEIVHLASDGDENRSILTRIALMADLCLIKIQQKEDQCSASLSD